MSRRQWPDDFKTANFEDITKPLVAAIKYAYKLERKNEGKSIPWSGLMLTSNSILACCPNIDERLEAENLAYDLDDQGREPIEVLVSCAVQLGIEQGLRMAKKNNEHALMMLGFATEALSSKP